MTFYLTIPWWMRLYSHFTDKETNFRVSITKPLSLRLLPLHLDIPLDSSSDSKDYYFCQMQETAQPQQSGKQSQPPLTP